MSAHYLRVIGGQCDEVVCVAVGLSTRQRILSVGPQSHRMIECANWSLRAHHVTPDNVAQVGSVDGGCVTDLWRDIAEIASESRVTWLWTLGLRELLILSDWYTLLEQGGFTVGGHDHGSEIPGDHILEKHFRGYLVDKDPPGIVLCQHRTSGKVLQMADVKNFGIADYRQLYSSVEQESGTMLPYGMSGAGTGAIARLRCKCIARWCIAWSQLVMRQHWGPLRPSAAGQAMMAYRSKHLNSPILVHDNERVRALERESYFPGRCECYRIGKVYGPVYHLDIASCYPSVTRDQLFPVRLKGAGVPSVGTVLGMIESGWMVIARVQLHTSNHDFPCRHNGMVCYPIGRFTTTLCGPELQLAIERGEVVNVEMAAWYEPGIVYTSWSDEMLALRQDATVKNVPGLLVGVKGITNALYGAWAKKKRQWIECSCSFPPSAWAHWWERQPPGHDCRLGPYWLKRNPFTGEPWTQGPYTQWRSIGWRVEYEWVGEDAPNTCPAIAAWASSLARVKLLEGLRAAGHGEVYYCDTDSLWCSERGYDNINYHSLLGRGQAGKLRLVARHACLNINGAKCYSAPNCVVYAGAPANATELPDGSKQWVALESTQSAMRNGYAPRGALVTRTRKLAQRYQAGMVMPDGTVRPLLIME